MDKTLQLQLQIRQNADEISSALKDMQTWQKTISKKDKNLKTEKKKIAPRRTGGGTVPLRTFAPVNPSVSSSNILTPASLVDSALSQAKIEDKTTLTDVSVPKAIGIYEAKDAEEAERERGNNEFKGGNFSAAVKSYTKCLGLKKNNYVAFSNRAMAYLKLKEYHRAVLDCNCALLIEPTHVKTLLRRSTAYNAMGKHRAALKDLLNAQNIEPSNKQVKLDILQTKELLRSAANRAPFITVNPFNVFVQEFIHQDPTATNAVQSEADNGNGVVEPEIIQGPDMPPPGLIPVTADEAHPNTEVESGVSSSFQRITIEDDNDNDNEQSEVPPQNDKKKEEEEEEEEEEAISLNNMKIHIIAEDEEEEQPTKTSPEKQSKETSKTSKAWTKASTSSKKKKTTPTTSSAPKSSYELEKFLLQHHPASPDKIRDFLSSTKRDKTVQLFKTCFEPSTLSLFLDVLVSDYSYQKDGLASSSSALSKARRVVAAYYREIGELSNFDMLIALLSNEEKERVIDHIESMKREEAAVNGEEIAVWENILTRYQR